MRRTLAVLALSFAGSCKTQPADEGTPPPLPPQSSPATTAPAASAQAAASPTRGSVRFVRAPEGEVANLVRTETARAQGDGRRLLVYEGATWCEPCQRFHRAAEHGDLDNVLPRLTLLEFDADQDGERLLLAGYSSRLIPLFALPGADGRSSGKQVEGGIKGDGAASYVATKVKDLLGP